MFCGQCGIEVPEGGVFCPNCGSRLIDDNVQRPKALEIAQEMKKKFCPNCGVENSMTDTYCKECGMPLDGTVYSVGGAVRECR